MMAIEKFTKQQIPVEIFPEFMPEPGEKAEPIAMGRQTIWAAPVPPSREVMAAAAKAARAEMMGASATEDEREGAQAGNQAGPGSSRGEEATPSRRLQDSHAAAGQGGSQVKARVATVRARTARTHASHAAKPGRGEFRGEGRRGGGQGSQGGQGGQGSGQRQPDPLRTGIDALGERGRNRGGRPGGGGRAARVAPGRQGGGGIDPLRTSYGRIKYKCSLLQTETACPDGTRRFFMPPQRRLTSGARVRCRCGRELRIRIEADPPVLQRQRGIAQFGQRHAGQAQVDRTPFHVQAFSHYRRCCPWARRRSVGLRTAVARDRLIVHGRAEQLAHAAAARTTLGSMLPTLAGVMVAQEAVQAPEQKSAT